MITISIEWRISSRFSFNGSYSIQLVECKTTQIFGSSIELCRYNCSLYNVPIEKFVIELTKGQNRNHSKSQYLNTINIFLVHGHHKGTLHTIYSYCIHIHTRIQWNWNFTVKVWEIPDIDLLISPALFPQLALEASKHGAPWFI